MALISDLKETVVLYQGAYSTIRYGGEHRFIEFSIDKLVHIKFEHTVTGKRLLTVEDSTDDMRWILNKLYNE